MSAYELTPLAKADVFSIWSHIASNSEKAADRVEQAIYDACAFQLRGRSHGHSRPDFTTRSLRFWTLTRYPNYAVAYRPETSPLQIASLYCMEREIYSRSSQAASMTPHHKSNSRSRPIGDASGTMSPTGTVSSVAQGLLRGYSRVLRATHLQGYSGLETKCVRRRPIFFSAAVAFLFVRSSMRARTTEFSGMMLDR